MKIILAVTVVILHVAITSCRSIDAPISDETETKIDNADLSDLILPLLERAVDTTTGKIKKILKVLPLNNDDKLGRKWRKMSKKPYLEITPLSQQKEGKGQLAFLLAALKNADKRKDGRSGEDIEDNIGEEKSNDGIDEEDTHELLKYVVDYLKENEDKFGGDDDESDIETDIEESKEGSETNIVQEHIKNNERVPDIPESVDSNDITSDEDKEHDDSEVPYTSDEANEKVDDENKIDTLHDGDEKTSDVEEGIVSIDEIERDDEIFNDDPDKEREGIEETERDASLEIVEKANIVENIVNCKEPKREYNHRHGWHKSYNLSFLFNR